MNEGQQVWQLLRGEEVVAELVVDGGDFPWLNARVQAAPGFEEIRPLFEAGLRRVPDLARSVMYAANRMASHGLWVRARHVIM